MLIIDTTELNAYYPKLIFKMNKEQYKQFTDYLRTNNINLPSLKHSRSKNTITLELTWNEIAEDVERIFKSFAGINAVEVVERET